MTHWIGDVECPECERAFDTESGMKIHLGMAHKEPEMCDCCGEEYEAPPSGASKYCSHDCYAEAKAEQVTGSNNPMKNPETAQKAADNHDYSKQREMLSGETNPMKQPKIASQFVGEGNPMSDPDVAKKAGASPIFVEETNRHVRSGWEAEIDRLLHASDIEYEYEPQSFDISGSLYTPDFITGDYVIEVKGRVFNQDRAVRFMTEHPEWTYVVVGSRLPCDVHIPWQEKEQLLEVVA